MKSQNNIKLWLAPMEGVVDSIMRDFLTSIGGIDACVTEFIRVTDKQIPDTVLYRNCPELLTQNSKTKFGVPVIAQFLGGQTVPLALSAARAVKLGAIGIDLNFGCPAKTVNRHDGGATLLKYPDRIYKIVQEVRRAIPANTPVSAKIRLGFENAADCLVNAEAISSAGASHLTVHCRTKTDHYKPPAYWEWIPKIKEKVNIPNIANGDIFSASDFAKCRDQTGCDQFMIGRGALQDPFVFRKIKGEQFPKNEVLPLILKFFDTNHALVNDRFAQSRTKQWLRNLIITNPELLDLFNQVKVIMNPVEFRIALENH